MAVSDAWLAARVGGAQHHEYRLVWAHPKNIAMSDIFDFTD
jgi:hypothetical protein